MSIYSDVWSRIRLAPRVTLPRAVFSASLMPALTVNTVGATTGNSPTVLDLEEQATEWHEGKLVFEVSSVNGQGGTPTSPGAAVTTTFNFGFSNFAITATDAPTVFATYGDLTALVITLPNSASSAAAGTRYWRSGELSVRGRYFWYWYDKQAYAANAGVLFTPVLVRV